MDLCALLRLHLPQDMASYILVSKMTNLTCCSNEASLKIILRLLINNSLNIYLLTDCQIEFTKEIKST